MHGENNVSSLPFRPMPHFTTFDALKLSQNHSGFHQLQSNEQTFKNGKTSVIDSDLKPADLGIFSDFFGDQSTGIVHSAFGNLETVIDHNPGVLVSHGAVSTPAHINDQIIGRDLTNAMTTMDDYLPPQQNPNNMDSDYYQPGIDPMLSMMNTMDQMDAWVLDQQSSHNPVSDWWDKNVGSWDGPYEKPDWEKTEGELEREQKKEDRREARQERREERKEGRDNNNDDNEDITPESEGNMMFKDESLMYEFVDVSVFQDPELLASGMVDSQMLFTGMMNSVDNFAENYQDLSQVWASPNDYSANQAYFG